MAVQFRDRRAAGRELAAHLESLRSERPVVLGLPRGGVPVAYEVALALDAPLDVIIVRKIGVPSQPELGMGAIGEGGTRALNERVLRAANVTQPQLDAVEARERAELVRRAVRFRGHRPMAALDGRTAVVVDDGLATGSTALAALRTARDRGARRVVLAVPVAPPDTVQAMSREAEVVVLHTPPDLRSVGEWYEDFRQVPDNEVVDLLAAAATRTGPGRVPEPDAGEVELDAGGVLLPGQLSCPGGASGVVLFAHGSGSGRHSPRNVAVARSLRAAGLATLLFDLLTPAEAADRANVFAVELLAERLGHATAWVRARPTLATLPIGYFGASTGAAAALLAAAEPGAPVDAVVSRGGRPDLAGARLAAVRAPTLLMVGSLDHTVLELNREAARALTCEHRLEVVAGASHLFEEPGTLERAAQLAAAWFTRHFGSRVAPAAPI